MKKKILISLVFILLMYVPNVMAANFSISAPSSMVSNQSYTVAVSYSGNTLGSVLLNMQLTNANCTLSSVATGGTPKFEGAFLNINFVNVNGYKSGTTFVKLNCKSSTKATFKASTSDAWDLEGLNEIRISSASKSINITSPEVTTQGTTKATTTSTTSKTTTKKGTTTTTSKTTSKNEKETTKPINQEGNSYPIQTEDTTTTSTSTTTENIIVPDDIKLQDLHIVGYSINFKPNCIKYEIEVDSKVTELYILANTNNEISKISNIGIIDIRNKDKITLSVYNEESKNSIDYTIIINRPSSQKGLIITKDYIIIFTIAVLIIIILCGLIYFLTRKNKHIKDTYIINKTAVTPPENNHHDAFIELDDLATIKTINDDEIEKL